MQRWSQRSPSAPSSAPPVCIFKLVVFPVCNKNSSGLWGKDPQVTCCPQCHSSWEDSAIWSLLGASLLDGAREEPARRPPCLDLLTSQSREEHP